MADKVVINIEVDVRYALDEGLNSIMFHCTFGTDNRILSAEGIEIGTWKVVGSDG